MLDNAGSTANGAIIKQYGSGTSNNQKWVVTYSNGFYKINCVTGAVSIPMAFWYFNPIPYAVLSANSGSKPTYFLGIYNNLLSTEIKFRAFEAPSSFGIGIDWSSKDNKWSKANVFVRGNISIGEF